MQISRAASVFKTDFKSKLSVFSWLDCPSFEGWGAGGWGLLFFFFFLILGVESPPPYLVLDFFHPFSFHGFDLAGVDCKDSLSRLRSKKCKNFNI